MKSRRRSYLVESDISVISIISWETSRERQTYNQKMGWRRVLSLSTARFYLGDEIGDHHKSTRRRWDELRSLGLLRWVQINFERIFWMCEWFLSVECEKNEFSFCILILDFISRVGNFEISSIKGCHRMHWKMLKFWGKISAGV